MLETLAGGGAGNVAGGDHSSYKLPLPAFIPCALSWHSNSWLLVGEKVLVS